MPQFILPDGKSLWYEDDGGGPVIVLVHGWCMSSLVWRFQFEGLRDSFRLIAPDLRGHGQSIDFFDGYGFSGFASDLRELFFKLDLWNVVLVGWSMGAQVALSAFDQLKERLSALVLVSGTSRFVSGEDYSHGLDASEVVGMEIGLRRNPLKTLERFANSMFAEGELGSDEQRGVIRELLRQAPFPERRVALESLKELRDADMRGILDSVDIPTLIVNGDKDRICLPGASDYMARRIAGSSHMIFKDCGHAPFLTHCNKFNNTITDFCGGIFDP